MLIGVWVERRLPILMAAAAAGLYLAWPSASYNFDGVACAIAVELGDLRHLAHGNHLAYGLLVYAAFLLGRAAGYDGPALAILQALNSLLGAAGVGFFTLLLRRCGLRTWSAALGALGLAVSSGYWIWSLEAQVYPLGAMFLFWTAAEAFGDRPSPVRVGLLQAAAALGHASHAMFFPTAFFLLGERGARRRYAATMAAAVLGAYLLAGVLCVRPQSWVELKLWLLGSGATAVDRRFRWLGGYSLAGTWDYAWATFRLFADPAWLGAPCLAAAAVGARTGLRDNPKVVRGCLWWLAGYAALFLAWEPYRLSYRLADSAPLWILVSIGLARLPIAAPAVVVLFLGGWNLWGEVRPGSDPGANADLQRALWLAREVPEDAWVMANGNDQVYVPYFARRKPLNIRYFELLPDERMGERIRGIQANGEDVYVVPETMPPRWRRWFAEHGGLKTTSQNGSWTLCRVSRQLTSPAGRYTYAHQ